MMASELSLWGVALIGSLAYGGGDFIGGRASLKLSPVGVIVLAQIAALAVAAQAIPWPARFLLTGPAAAHSAFDTLIPGLSGGLFYAIALSALYTGIARGRAALVTPVFGIVSLAVPLLADLMLGRSLTQMQAGGLLMCGAAIVMLAQVSEARSDRRRHFSVRLGIIGGLADGAADVSLGILPPAQAFDSLLLARAVMVVLALALFALVLILRPTEPRRAPARRSRRTLAVAALLAIGAGICDALGHVSYVALATQGHVAIASALVGVLSSAVVILLAVLLLKERLAPAQMAGFAAGALGIAALAG